MQLYRDSVSCATDAVLSSTLEGSTAHIAPSHCPCDSYDQNELSQKQDGSVAPGNYGCDAPSCSQTSAPDPEICDGHDTDGSAPFDEGCGDSEGCRLGDQDLAPVRFSSGRVESNPITLFSLPTPEGISFEYRIVWGSHVTNKPASARLVNGTQDTVPKIHDHDEETHFLGNGWQDSFSDRLFINTRNKPATLITWRSMNGTVTFSASSGWKSWNGKYELIDRGANPADGLGRWVVRTTDSSGPRQIWAFDEFTYDSYGGSQYVYALGRLRRRALLTSNLANLTGRYGYTIDWTSTGVIDKVTDTLGREISISYRQTTNGSVTTSRTVNEVRYRPAAAATQLVVASLTFDPRNALLDRATRPGVSGYTRFLYWNSPPSDCQLCGSALTDVLVPGPLTTSTPTTQAPPLASEIALEHNEYTTAVFTNYKIPLASKSKYPGREYAYTHSTGSSTQFDLHQDVGSCSAGCPSGSACRDSRCYVATIINHDTTTRRQLAKGGATGGGPTLGAPGSHQSSWSASGAARRVTGPDGRKTTYGVDSVGRIRCLVHDDNDDEAFATPSAPDTSACAGPPAAQVIRVDYTNTTRTKTIPSSLSGDVTEVETLDGVTLLPTVTSRTGKTRDINGALITQAQNTTTTFDAVGRVVEVNGPLADSVALDKTTTSYYTSFDSSWPHNYGRVFQVTRYVGTSSSNMTLTTTFAEYDISGIPHRVTDPNGQQVTYTDSSDRLTWTILEVASGATSVIKLNVDGTVRSMQDADGVCMTYEYSDASGYVGAPTKVRRSNTSCGVLPININDGEVEIRTYASGEPDRLKTIERRMNGIVHFQFGEGLVAGTHLKYDRERRLTEAKRANTNPFIFGFTDVLPSSVAAPDAPGPASSRTEDTADAFGRPSSLLRFLDASNKQSYAFSYSSPLSPRPTQLVRGYNGSATATTTYVYDDFSRLVETVVPEAGTPGAPSPTRYEYDAAGRMTKKRVGVGSALVRTSVYSYDSLGRTTYVDHDVEHPVNCASAPAGTPIQDEEYKYDSCPLPDAPSGFSCSNAIGRLTIARAILQCGSAGQVVKRGRWYSYSPAGRATIIAYATVTGSVVGTSANLSSTYTLAGRLSGYMSPLNFAFGTAYQRSSSNGRTQTVTTSTSPSALIANALSYRSFGPLVGMTTAVTQPAGASHRTLKMINSVTGGFDYTLGNLRWYLEHFSPFEQSIALMDQAIGYTPSGVPQTRVDTADQYASRWYGYDALVRMTCEARGGFGAQSPTSADCSTSSPRVAGLYTYGNAESASSPPDARLSSFIKSENTSGAACSTTNRCYLSPSNESSTYAGGSGQPQGVTRTGSSLVLTHDALGRRTSEYDNFDNPRSLREYAYLPNGQLGTITGRPALNAASPYTYSMRYDERGRPLTIVATSAYSGSDTYELFWDEQDRLVSVEIQIPPRDSLLSPVTSIRWHYHYVDSLLVAVTRELYRTQSPTNVKRFWAVTDERGLVHRLLDEQGATFWQARWEASGWRTFVGTPQPEMWVPFGLPGQVILGSTWAYGITPPRRGTGFWQGGTEAFASGAGGTWTRPPIALNQWRAYDPLSGSFLQPDQIDQEGRLSPEGYAYGRSRPVVSFDRNGLYTTDGCSPAKQHEIRHAINEAWIDIQTCAAHACASRGADILRRQWSNALMSTNYICLDTEVSIPGIARNMSYGFVVREQDGALMGWHERDFTGYAATQTDTGDTFLTQFSNKNTPCLKQLLAHETLHRALYLTPGWIHWARRFQLPWFPRLSDVYQKSGLIFNLPQATNGFTGKDVEESQVILTTDACVQCPQTKK
ncbi:MAG: hypothetical protein M4D80_38145 [Myxococcota bacterium]|nr:hypothetical protein [Myxococcota bacterium]